MSVTSGASRARKTSSSSTMMNASDRNWISESVEPDLDCWSTLIATAPARCTDRPGGGPSLEIVARMSLTSVVSPLPLPPPLTVESTWSCAARPSGEWPRSRTFATVGTWPRSCSSLLSQAWSAGVSGPWADAATTGTGVRVDAPSGAASCRACSLGALAGRKLALLPWVTLDNEGRARGTPTAATTHTRMTSHRNFTAKEPIPPNIA